MDALIGDLSRIVRVKSESTLSESNGAPRGGEQHYLKSQSEEILIGVKQRLSRNSGLLVSSDSYLRAEHLIVRKQTATPINFVAQFRL